MLRQQQQGRIRAPPAHCLSDNSMLHLVQSGWWLWQAGLPSAVAEWRGDGSLGLDNLAFFKFKTGCSISLLFMNKWFLIIGFSPCSLSLKLLANTFTHTNSPGCPLTTLTQTHISRHVCAHTYTKVQYLCKCVLEHLICCDVSWNTLLTRAVSQSTN